MPMAEQEIALHFKAFGLTNGPGGGITAQYKDLMDTIQAGWRTQKASFQNIQKEQGTYFNLAQRTKDAIGVMNQRVQTGTLSAAKALKGLESQLQKLQARSVRGPIWQETQQALQGSITSMGLLAKSEQERAMKVALANKQEKERLAALKAQESQLNSMVGKVAAIAATYVGIGATLKAIGSGVEFNKMIEQNTMAFSVMLKSNEAAAGLISKFRTLQTTAGIGIRESSDAARQLLAYGFKESELIDNMKMLKTVAGAVGVPLKDIAYVYGTLRSQGRAYTRDLMQFAMRGIPIYEALADTMGVQVSQIKKMTEDGKIGFAEVEKAIVSMTTNGGQFAGMLEGRMKTLTGQTELLGFEFESLMGRMTSGASSPLMAVVRNITGMFSGKDTGLVTNSLQAVLANMQPAIEGTVRLLLQLGDTVAVFAQAASGPLSIMITALTGITKLVAWLLANPLGGAFLFASTAALAISSITTAVTGLTTAMSGLSGATTGFGLVLNTIGKNPWIMAVSAAIAAGGLVFTVVSDAAKTKFGETNLRDFASSSQSVGLSMAISRLTGNVLSQEIDDLAKRFGLSIEEVRKKVVDAGKTLADSVKPSKEALDSFTKIVSPQTGKMGLGALSAMGVDLGAIAVQLAKEGFTKSAAVGAPATGSGAIDYKARAGLIPLTGEGVLKNLQAIDPEKYPGVQSLIADIKNAQASQLETLAKAVADLQEAGSQEQAAAIMGLADTLRTKVKEFDFDPYRAAKIQAGLTATQLDDISVIHQEEMANLDDKYKYTIKSLDDGTAKYKEYAAIRKALDDKYHKDTKDAMAEETAQRVQAEYEIRILEAESLKDSFKASQLRIDMQKELLALDRTSTPEQLKLGEAKIASEESSLFLDVMREAGEWLAEPLQKLSGKLKDIQTGLLMYSGKALSSGFIDSPNTLGGNMANVGQVASGVGATVGAFALQGIITMVDAMDSMSKAIIQATGVMDMFSPVIESVSKALQPMLRGIANIAGPAITRLAQLMTRVLAPVVAIIAGGFQILASALIMLEPIFNLVIDAMWFVYDSMAEVANALIKFYNWLPFTDDLPLIPLRSSLGSVAEAAEDAARKLEKTQDLFGEVTQILKDLARSIYDKQLESLRSLYEVGASTAKEYEDAAKKAYDDLATALGRDEMLTKLEQSNLSLKTIAALLKDAVGLQELMSSSAWGTMTTEQKQASLDTFLGNVSAATSTGATQPLPAPTAPTPAPVYPRDLPTEGQGASPYIPRSIDSYTNDQLEANLAQQGLLSFGSDTPSGYYRNVIDAAGGLHDSGRTKRQLENEYRAWLLQFYYSTGISSFDVGTSFVPQDMLSNIHKGEGIIPATFNEGIQNGDYALVSGKNYNSDASQPIVVYLTVEGNVTTEENLTRSVANAIRQGRSSGWVSA